MWLGAWFLDEIFHKAPGVLAEMMSDPICSTVFFNNEYLWRVSMRPRPFHMNLLYLCKYTYIYIYIHACVRRSYKESEFKIKPAYDSKMPCITASISCTHHQGWIMSIFNFEPTFPVSCLKFNNNSVGLHVNVSAFVREADGPRPSRWEVRSAQRCTLPLLT